MNKIDLIKSSIMYLRFMMM